jgi:hypothetical protein
MDASDLIRALPNSLRGAGRPHMDQGRQGIKWTRLSCRTFAANAVRLQLHALAYNLGNFLRTLATPEPIKDWSMTSLGRSSSRSARRSVVTSPSRRPRIPRTYGPLRLQEIFRSQFNPFAGGRRQLIIHETKASPALGGICGRFRDGEITKPGKRYS